MAPVIILIGTQSRTLNPSLNAALPLDLSNRAPTLGVCPPPQALLWHLLALPSQRAAVLFRRPPEIQIEAGMGKTEDAGPGSLHPYPTSHVQVKSLGCSIFGPCLFVSQEGLFARLGVTIFNILSYNCKCVGILSQPCRPQWWACLCALLPQQVTIWSLRPTPVF